VLFQRFSFPNFSILEVGTGFHPELTGRIPFQYFSFQCFSFLEIVLGMSRAEIRKKFDEIVAFAEVEKFLDTPVKRHGGGRHDQPTLSPNAL